MRGITTCIILLFFLHTPMRGCDFCGCSVSGSSLGLIPNTNSSFIGLRTSFSFYSYRPPTSILAAGTSKPYPMSLVNLEVNARAILSRRIQIMAWLPYQLMEDKQEGLTARTLGNLLLRGYYTLHATDDSSQGKRRFYWLGGYGIYIPTGTSTSGDGVQASLPNTGLGSFGQSLSTIAVIGQGKSGIYTEANWETFLPNRTQYQPAAGGPSQPDTSTSHAKGVALRSLMAACFIAAHVWMLRVSTCKPIPAAGA